VLLLLVAVSLALGWILWPFYGTILWGSVIALLFTPAYRRLLPALGGRRTSAALLTMLIVLVIVVLPFALVMAALAGEAGTFYVRVQSGGFEPTRYFRGLFDALPSWVVTLIHRAGVANFDALVARLGTAAQQGAQTFATWLLAIGQNTFEFVAGTALALYLAFFLIRDGDAVMRALRQAVPLAPEHQQDLLDKFGTVVRATVKGNLLVAAIQGALGGLAFWALDIGAPLLWAVLMAFLSLLPAVGAGLVWLPVAAYLMATGALWSGIALASWGVLVIGLVDNLLRPLLVGKDTRMPDYVVMMTTLGGMAVFGINGFVVGPAIAAMFIATWHIHTTMRAAAAARGDGGKPPRVAATAPD
jgi:predicted PurR-regulated permease PerM